MEQDKIKINKSIMKGTFLAPPSKSYTHRALFGASFCLGKSIIYNIEYSDDINATISCLEKLGVKFIKHDGEEIKSKIEVIGIEDLLDSLSGKEIAFDCKESGTTYRFLKPITDALRIKAKFNGSERLLNRVAHENNIFDFSKDSIEVDGSISSQYISGVLTALSFLKKDIKLIIKNDLVSKPYVDMTKDVIKHFGISNEYTIEGDYSNASFFSAMNLFSDINIDGLNEDSLQGDKAYIKDFEIIRSVSKNYLDEKNLPVIDVIDTPDLVPILSVYAALNNGIRLKGTKRLKYKESDRPEALKCELIKCGVDVIIEDDSMTIIPKNLHSPDSEIDSHNDHRIAMAMTVLGLKYGDMVLNGVKAVNKSFPDYFENIIALGGNIKTL